MINTSITSTDLKKYIETQIFHLMPDGIFTNGMIKDDDIQIALNKCENCFKHIINGAYSDENGNTFFSHLHADQYAMFLEFLANYIWKEREEKIVCDHLMYLNRILHGFMMSYKCHLPDIWWLGHPVGAVIGNAEYSDYLYISQNSTINTGPLAEDGSCTPKIGKYFSMGAGAMLYNTALEDNSIVINNCGTMEIRKSKKISMAQKLFR